MPPAPMTAPRYRFRSGDAGVRIPLAVEQVAERGGVPLVDPEERDEDQTHPHRLGPEERGDVGRDRRHAKQDRKSTRLNSSHGYISYAVFCLKKKKKKKHKSDTMQKEMSPSTMTIS